MIKQEFNFRNSALLQNIVQSTCCQIAAEDWQKLSVPLICANKQKITQIKTQFPRARSQDESKPNEQRKKRRAEILAAKKIIAHAPGAR